MTSRIEQAARHKARVRQRELVTKGWELNQVLKALDLTPKPEPLGVHEARQEVVQLLAAVVIELKQLRGVRG